MRIETKIEIALVLKYARRVDWAQHDSFVDEFFRICCCRCRFSLLGKWRSSPTLSAHAHLCSRLTERRVARTRNCLRLSNCPGEQKTGLNQCTAINLMSEIVLEFIIFFWFHVHKKTKAKKIKTRTKKNHALRDLY